MAINQNTHALLQKIFAEIWPRTGWVNPSVLMLGRQDTRDLGKGPEDVFRGFGFSEVSSLDVTDSEGANIVHDLNVPIPSDLHQRFDCVHDGGTVEHVFDVKTAMFNIHNLLKPGGVVLQTNPVNNYINHGFYQFSPAFYFGFYDQNGYTVESLYILASVKNTSIANQAICEVTGDGLRSFGLGSRIVFPDEITPKHMLGSMFVARKAGTHKEPVVPQQPIYSDRYAGPEFDQFKCLIQI